MIQKSRKTNQKYLIVTGIIALILGVGIHYNSSFKSISPCVMQLAVTCNDTLDKTRINYSVTNYGYPAIYKKTALSEQLNPRPYMSSNQEIVKTNAVAILVDVLFWFLLLNAIVKFAEKKPLNKWV